MIGKHRDGHNGKIRTGKETEPVKDRAGKETESVKDGAGKETEPVKRQNR